MLSFIRVAVVMVSFHSSRNPKTLPLKECKARKSEAWTTTVLKRLERKGISSSSKDLKR